MHYVYLLLLNDGRIYKGLTSDLKRRLGEHKRNKVKSTRKKNPLLIHYEAYLLKSDAERREKFLKTTEGRRLLRQQIRDFYRDRTGVGSPGHPTGRPDGYQGNSHRLHYRENLVMHSLVA